MVINFYGIHLFSSPLVLCIEELFEHGTRVDHTFKGYFHLRPGVHKILINLPKVQINELNNYDSPILRYIMHLRVIIPW